MPGKAQQQPYTYEDAEAEKCGCCVDPPTVFAPGCGEDAPVEITYHQGILYIVTKCCDQIVASFHVARRADVMRDQLRN